MRPLCGAIVTAGALIGLGLFSLGYGTRYAAYAERNETGHFRDDYWVKFSQMDTTLIFVMVLLTASLLIGLAVAFIGLAYHHHKRTIELHRHHAHPNAPAVGGPAAPIGVSRYDDGLGHPLWLGRDLFGQLQGLHGDKGVWKLIESGRYLVTEVDAIGKAPLDVNDWEDYRALLAQYEPGHTDSDVSIKGTG